MDIRRSVAEIAVISVAVFNLPHLLAAIIFPCCAAMVLMPDTKNSLLMIIITIHTGAT
jgi:hypothetical protein